MGIHISSLALLKMMKHGRAGVPFEVMGLMLGDFVDDYTVRVADVFAMPQSGTGVSVVAVVIDPIQSVKGKVVIDAFRTINTQMIMLGQEPRQTTSNLGHLQKPSIQALIHGLNRHYYSMPIVYRKNEHEQQMLMNLHKSKWQDSLSIADFEKCKQKNIESINNMVKLAKVRLFSDNTFELKFQ